jgi:uncharacterized cupredoxin-like copper-binding protein
MRRLAIGGAVAVLAGIGVVAGFVLPASSATATPASASKVITITVVAREWSFKLSRSSVPVGSTVVFKVTNKGKIGHDFKINGKKTPLIAPGKTKSIKVVFKKKGKIAFLCTVTGHAKLGMKGTFSVGVKAVTTTTATTTTTTTTTTTCTSPTNTVVVQMKEYTFLKGDGTALSGTTLPSGCTQFNISNVGNEVHNFDISGVHSGALLGPGQNESWDVNLKAGQYLFVCDVPFHVDRGMTGNFTVSP